MIFQIYVKHLVRLRCNIYLKYRLQQLKIYVPSYILIAILLRVIVKYNIFFFASDFLRIEGLRYKYRNYARSLFFRFLFIVVS